jgi:hypothetical protein
MDSGGRAARMKRQCVATASSTGERCTKAPIRGATVCATHGGSVGRVKAAAARREAEAAATAAAAKYGAPVTTTSPAALRDELNRTAGIIDWLTARVQALDEGDLTWGTERRIIKTPGPGQGSQQSAPQMEVTQSGRPHVYVAMLERERHHLAGVAAEMARLGIEARVARAAELAGAQIVAVLEAYARELGHDPRGIDVQIAASRALAAVPGA